MRTGTKTIFAALAIVAGALLLTAGPAGAQQGADEPYVVNANQERNSGASPQVLSGSAERGSAQSASSNAGSLPFVGGDVAGMLLIGGFAVALGGLLIVSRRRVTSA